LSSLTVYKPHKVALRPTFRDRIKAAIRSYRVGPISLRDPALARFFGEGHQTEAGIVVTPENAFTFSAVYDAVRQISSDVAKMPLNLLKRLPGGGSEHYIDSKLYRLLKYEPNPEMSSMVFRRTLTRAHAQGRLRGNRARPVRSTGGPLDHHAGSGDDPRHS
jgi:phage portal protein BeeE